jgi:hypothetical protein
MDGGRVMGVTKATKHRIKFMRAERPETNAAILKAFKLDGSEVTGPTINIYFKARN